MAVDTDPRYEDDEVAFLDALDDDQRTWLHERGVVRSFSQGTALFHEHEESDRVMFVLSGRVKIASASDDGRERVLAFRGPGEVLGELSAIDGRPRSASVIAVDPVQALVLPAGDFRLFLERSPKVTLYLLTKLVARLREADRKRVEFGAQDTIGRVAARLVELSERYGKRTPEGVRIDLPITQEELASWVGSSREGVNKALHTLRSLGWVDVERRSFTVLDMEALRRRST
jgi:CRP/FNR family transcriptional regulator, cyclic AMP receptor protein